MTYTIAIQQDFNTASQIRFLKQAGHFENDSSVISASIFYTSKALELSKQTDLPIRILNIYVDGFSQHLQATDFTTDKILRHMSELPADANKTVTQAPSDAENKRRVEFIKQQTGLKTDEDAVRFALQFTHDIAGHMQQCKGKAYIGFIKNWKGSYTRMITVFDKTLRAKFRRAGRKVKNTVRNILPQKKEAPQPKA